MNQQTLAEANRLINQAIGLEAEADRIRSTDKIGALVLLKQAAKYRKTARHIRIQIRRRMREGKRVRRANM